MLPRIKTPINYLFQTPRVIRNMIPTPTPPKKHAQHTFHLWHMFMGLRTNLPHTPLNFMGKTMVSSCFSFEKPWKNGENNGLLMLKPWLPPDFPLNQANETTFPRPSEAAHPPAAAGRSAPPRRSSRGDWSQRAWDFGRTTWEDHGRPKKKHDQWWPVVKSHDLMFILILLMNSDDSIWNMLCDACCMLCDVWYMICDMLFARCRSYSCSPCFDVGKQPGTNRQRITGCLTRPMSFKERNAGVGSSLPSNLRSREFRCRWSR